MFGKVMPGEYKGYKPGQLNEAIAWASGGDKPVFQEEGDSKE